MAAGMRRYPKFVRAHFYTYGQLVNFKKEAMKNGKENIGQSESVGGLKNR